MAAECSPGRKPGDQSEHTTSEPALAGDRNVWIADSVWVGLSPLRGSLIIFNRLPRADARGYTLPPAFAGSLKLALRCRDV